MSHNLRATVRMYNVGELGDCFHLSFKLGDAESNVLIDCGSFRNSMESKLRLNAIVSDIKSKLGEKKLDVVIGTHQRNDHMSGFVHCKPALEGRVEQVWLSWLDDPKDTLADAVLQKKEEILNSLVQVQKKLPVALRTNSVLSELLGFFGVDGNGKGVPAEGVRNLKMLGEKPPKYLSPGKVIPLPGMPEDAVKVYVLGPPRDRKKIHDATPGKGESYDHSLALASIHAARLSSAVEMDDSSLDDYPFSSIFRVKERDYNNSLKKNYKAPENSWRKIEDDWLGQADRLALYLDTYTNNSSLVLAFELVKSGKILLFAADAQTGNWLSWDDINWGSQANGKTTKDILANTVLYKVGHHGSHNATLKASLEAMTHDDLVVMIPVHKDDANITKVNGWKMPAANLYKRLQEKTSNRVLRMDTGYANGSSPNDPKSGWNAKTGKPKHVKGVYVEYEVTE